MLFNSFTYLLLFLPPVVVGFYLLARRAGRRAALAWLVLASLLFYGWWNPPYLLLLLGSAGFNFVTGGLIRLAGGRRRRALLVGGVAVNLLLLAYFKYMGFLLSTLGLHWNAGGIVLPLAISFFTFTQITYLVDSSRGAIEDDDLLHYLLFVTYFPHLIAGPIIHHPEMVRQFRDPDAGRLPWRDVAAGLTLIVVGLSKKVLLAQPFAGWSEPVFAAAQAGQVPSAPTAWAGAAAFALQIYFDFSAYTDMALGSSLLLGLRLPLNFNSPFKATSVIDYWQRWHISLTRFLTDYIYSPVLLSLTRRRAQSGRKIFVKALPRDLGAFAVLVCGPTLLTMAVAGVWHGAGWHYLLFGVMHGAFLVANHAWRLTRKLWAVPVGVVERLAGRTLTLLAVLAGFVMFQAASVPAAGRIYRGMLAGGGAGTAAPDALWLAALAGGFALCWLAPNAYQLLARYRPHLSMPAGTQPAPSRIAWRPSMAWLAPSATVAAAALVALGGHVKEFIYFQF
ncbi:MAG: alginate O-acetyltransferase [Phenylobacterium sp.]|nr:alginate O-acetyltransferase [Phenylobacterium sp.]